MSLVNSMGYRNVPEPRPSPEYNGLPFSSVWGAVKNELQDHVKDCRSLEVLMVHGEVKYKDYRREVIKWFHTHVPGFNPTRHVLYTTYATWLVFRRAYPLKAYSDFLELVPNYVAGHMAMGAVSDAARWLGHGADAFLWETAPDVGTAAPLNLSNENQEQIMSKKYIETVTFINGARLDQATDEHIYATLSEIETEQAKFAGTSHQTKSMAVRRLELAEQADAIVKAVDARDETRKSS